MNLAELKASWQNTPESHRYINDTFFKKVNEVEWMCQYRDFIEQNAFGFGERSFLWLWKILMDEMPSSFSFLEIGVFRGQILCLIRMLASSTVRDVQRYGVTPLDSSDGHWQSNYENDIKVLHGRFYVPQDYTIYKGLSTNPKIALQAINSGHYDLVYIDGSHQYSDVVSDLSIYPFLLKRGGYLLIDDACCDMDMDFGYFTGIEPVTKATLEWIDMNQKDWEFIANVVHILIFKRR